MIQGPYEKIVRMAHSAPLQRAATMLQPWLRAREAIRFAANRQRGGCNLFVIGEPGSAKRSAVP